tara:strand:- start:6653 stop:8920 length:2268 start_codon:yes stop_codon:yes gene_type:complete
MNLKLIGSLFFFLLTTIFFGQQNFYQIESVKEIKFYFSQPNWKHILDSLYVLGDEQRLTGHIEIDGTQYDSVGIRYKGYSSVNITQTKNPFNVKLDYIIEDQEHQGFNKIKLSNVIHDPSFLREALSYQIARKYMPASEANFANLFINDTLWGIYSNVEAVNKDFLEKHYQSRSNSFFKCNPKNLDLFGENSNLNQSHGNDSSSYEDFYTLKSDDGWEKLYHLIDTLNNNPNSINQILNIDRTLWMHAFNYSLINLDSYIGYAQNYYLYEDNSGRFNPILWDLNMSFGSFRLTDASSYFSGFSVLQAKTLDPLTHFNDISVFPRPLMRKLFNDDRYKKMYMAHLKTIIEENFSNSDFLDSANKIRSIIDSSVLADTNKFYSYSDFQNNLDSTVNYIIDYPGINDLMSSRTSYLTNYPGFNHIISIDSINESISNPNIGDDLWISCKVIDANEVILFHRTSNSDIFEQTTMLDNGLNGDLVAGDLIYGANISNIGNQLQYYIYAENDSSGQFSPKRAAYEYYEINIPLSSKDIVINELLAINDNVIQNQFGDYADWTELYNTTNSTLSTEGLYLSDQDSNLKKWLIPEISIPANNYLIIWADQNKNQGIMHANFELSSNGENLILSDNSGLVIDSIQFPTQSTDVAFARIPNGYGPFVYNEPSFNYNNDFANINLNDKGKFKCYPNPFNKKINIIINDCIPNSINIIDIHGRKLNIEKKSSSKNIITLNTEHLKKGMYFVQLFSHEEMTLQKIIKN